MTAGPWRLYEEVRDLSGDQFEALVKSPVIEGDVTPALLARVGTIVSGHVDSEVGATLALWRSIEAQGERDLTGSSLQFEFDVAGFIDEYLALRFFSEESLTGAGAVKRQVTTLMVDLNSGVAIGLDDIIIDGDSRVALLVFVQEILLSDYFDGDTDAFNLWAGDLAPGDIDRAVLTPDGIEIWFDELEVGPPDIGTPVIAIPFDLIEGLLDPSGPVAVLGT